jgi:CheY-like chemotaxis protein
VSKRILVVDDIPINCKILAMHLQRMDITVDTAANGEEAVEACLRNHYTMIFMDLDMPVMDGIQATHLIRQYELTLGKHTPILALTSFDRTEVQQRCIREGMDGFLRKGLGGEEIAQVINSYCLEDTGSRYPSILDQRKAKDKVTFEAEVAELNHRFGSGLNEIISEFIFFARGLRDEFERVIANRNSRELTHVAYSLKGSCSNVGLPTMAALCAQISDEGYAGRWHRVSTNYRVLMQMLTTVQEHFAETVRSSD